MMGTLLLRRKLKTTQAPRELMKVMSQAELVVPLSQVGLQSEPEPERAGPSTTEGEGIHRYVLVHELRAATAWRRVSSTPSTLRLLELYEKV